MGGERVRARKKNRQLISGSRASDGVGGGGNEIAGLLMFGGALAAAAFVAVVSFAFNKNKTKDAAIHPKPKPRHQQQLSLENSEEDDHEIETIQEGLGALLQPSTTPTNDGDASASAGHGGVDMKSTINNTCIITEDKIEAVPQPYHSIISEEVHEIVPSDDSNPESEALLLKDSGIEEECFDKQGCSESQDVAVEAQEIEQSVEVETESQGATGDVVSEIDKEEDFCPAQEDTDAAIGWVSVTGEASSDEKDSHQDQPSAQGGGEVVSEIDKEDGSLLNYNENHDFCPAYEADKIDTTDAAIGAVTVTHEASSDEKDSDQSSAASNSFQLPTRVMPLLLLPLLFLLLLLIHRTQQFFSVI